MLAKISFWTLLVLATSSVACDFTTGPPPPCGRTVVLDAGVDGLPDVGEYCSTEICQALCGNNSSCRRMKELVLTCDLGCI
jgi:hypothetical protein